MQCLVFCGNSSACREKGNAADDNDDDGYDDKPMDGVGGGDGGDDENDGGDVLDLLFCSQAD